MREDFGLSQASVLLIYLGDGWVILPCQRGNPNPNPQLPAVALLGCLFISKIKVGGFCSSKGDLEEQCLHALHCPTL